MRKNQQLKNPNLNEPFYLKIIYNLFLLTSQLLYSVNNNDINDYYEIQFNGEKKIILEY